jgi:hypothetical protein
MACQLNVVVKVLFSCAPAAREKDIRLLQNLVSTKFNPDGQSTQMIQMKLCYHSSPTGWGLKGEMINHKDIV